MTNFPFDDLHGFKDFVVFVGMCAPDNFPKRDSVPDEDQWTLDLAFQGLRKGIALAVIEKGEKTEFSESLKLVEEAYQYYKDGNKREGFFTIDKVRKILGRIHSK